MAVRISLEIPERSSSKSQTSTGLEDLGFLLEKNIRQRELASQNKKSLKSLQKLPENHEYWTNEKEIYRLNREDSSILQAKKLQPAKRNLRRDTFAFVSLVIDRLADRGNTIIKDGDQAQFKTEMCQFYDAVMPGGPLLTTNQSKRYRFQSIWCPVMHQYFPYDEMTAAHIVPHSIGDVTMKRIFGDDHDRWSAENGLLLYGLVEPFFNDMSITIIPTTDHDGEAELQIRVLERRKCWLDTKISGTNVSRGELHDRKLIFKGPKRPKSKYLYLMYLISLHKCLEENRAEGRRAESARSRKVFASLTPSLRKSMVPAFAAQLGQDITTTVTLEEDKVAAAAAENEDELELTLTEPAELPAELG